MGPVIQVVALNTWAAFFPGDAPRKEEQRHGGYTAAKTKGREGGRGRREVPGGAAGVSRAAGSCRGVS